MSGELSFSLLCFNIDKKFDDRRSHSYLSDAKADLYFLQEDDKSISADPGLTDHDCTKYYE